MFPLWVSLFSFAAVLWALVEVVLLMYPGVPLDAGGLEARSEGIFDAPGDAPLVVAPVSVKLSLLLLTLFLVGDFEPVLDGSFEVGLVTPEPLLGDALAPSSSTLPSEV